MLINNSIEFQAIINMKMSVVLSNVMEKLLFELGNIIDEEVYSYESDGAWDGRTMEFKNSWTTSMPTLMDGWWTSTLDNQGFNFTHNTERDSWAHGNGWSALTVNQLNEIIDNRSGGSNFGFPSLKRPYWKKFLTFCDTSLESIFQQECVKQGLPLEYSTVFFE